jgi:hypothetical protein
MFGCFNPREELWYPLNRRLGGPQRRYAHFGEEKNILSLLGFEPCTMQPVEQSFYPSFYLGSQNFALEQAKKAWP